MNDKTAFSEEGKFGAPQNRLGPMEQHPDEAESPALGQAIGPPEDSGPVGPTDEEMGRPAYEEAQQEALAKKNFNRSRMGGFLMELGLNILSSNRDDAGAAIGEAGGKAFAQMRADNRASAAENLARQERERKQRREDESDTLKEEKAAREQAKAARDARAEDRAISKADLDKYQKFELEDGSVAFYEKREGPVYDKAGNKIKLDKKDRDRLSANNIETSIRALHRDLAAEEARIRDTAAGFNPVTQIAIPDDEVRALAKKRVKARLKTAKEVRRESLYTAKDVDEFDEEEYAADDPFGIR